MKLYPLDQTSKLVSKITNVSRRLKIRVLTQEAVELGDIIIIGNGTPDDIAVAIIAHHLNGDRIVGIVKPRQRRGLNVVELIPKYLSQNPHAERFVIITDQDDNPVDDLFEECHKKLNSFGISINNEESERQLKKYECERGNKTFSMILVINGISEIPVSKHTIEDHLLKVAIDEDLIEEITKELESSKQIWKNLKQDQRNEISNC